MNRNETIFVAGGAGMVGSAIMRRLVLLGFTHIVASYHIRQPIPKGEGQAVRYVRMDLTRQSETEAFLKEVRPRYIFLAAAKVGGILANSTSPAEFIYQNIAIATNIIHGAYVSGVKKMVNIGSSCIYPKFAPQPMKEEHLLTGALEPTNEAYAIAKISAIKLCRYYNEQYGTEFLSAMPTNLYGPYDNFDLEKSHVIPALIRKFHLARLLDEGRLDLVRRNFVAWGSGAITPLGLEIDEQSSVDDVLRALRHFGIYGSSDATPNVVRLWGTGEPQREFMHVDDLADACVFLMEKCARSDVGEFVNVGTGRSIAIRDLAQLVADIVGFKGAVGWDHTMPDGTPEKALDISKISGWGWKPRIELAEGLAQTYRWHTSDSV